MKKRLSAAAAVIVGLGALSLDGAVLIQGKLAVSDAQAVRGRPATPVSYAGVARRTTRRTVAATAAVTTACVQTVDAYGRVITSCH